MSFKQYFRDLFVNNNYYKRIKIKYITFSCVQD